MEDKLEKLLQKVRDANFKLTSQREDVLKVFLNEKDKHLSAEEVYDQIKKENPKVGLATVYRTLELFSQLGILQPVTIDPGCQRYELASEEGHHHHLICLNCQKVIEFNDSLLEEFEEKLETEYGFDVKDHIIKFYGICKDCR